MKENRNTSIVTSLRCLTFFALALLLLVQVMPRAFGQRHGVTSKRVSGVPSHTGGGTWTATGSLNTGRFLHSATVLPNGMVLVVGGNDPNFHPTATAEL
jgi:hypothetical protein